MSGESGSKFNYEQCILHDAQIRHILEKRTRLSHKEFADLFYGLTGDEHYEYEIPDNEENLRDDSKEESYDIFRTGNKVLSLMNYRRGKNKDLQVFQTEIANDPNKEPMNGATTLLYEAAKKHMLQEARRKKEVMRYELTTGSKSMIMWALKKGDTIFDWKTTFIMWDNPATGMTERLDPETLDLSNKKEEDLYALFTAPIKPTEE